MLVAVFGIASFSFEAIQNIEAQQQGVDVLPDVTSNISLIMTDDLPGNLAEEVTTKQSAAPLPKPIELSVEDKLTNIVNGDWKTYNSTICKMSIEYPANFTVKEKENRFDQRLPFTIVSGNPFLSLLVNCAKSDQMFIDVDASDMDSVIDVMVDDYDDFLVEDTNMTKWKLDNKTTASFVYGLKYESGNTGASEVLYTYHDGKDILVSLMTYAAYFDLPELQEIEKRMINSIEFYD